MFIEAHRLFKENAYLECAKTTGECVWKKGLLRKGFGLCHGICGNAYSLMSLYSYTGDEIWRKRA